MRVQIVENQPNHRDIGVGLIHQPMPRKRSYPLPSQAIVHSVQPGRVCLVSTPRKGNEPFMSFLGIPPLGADGPLRTAT